MAWQQDTPDVNYPTKYNLLFGLGCPLGARAVMGNSMNANSFFVANMLSTNILADDISNFALIIGAKFFLYCSIIAKIYPWPKVPIPNAKGMQRWYFGNEWVYLGFSIMEVNEVVRERLGRGGLEVEGQGCEDVHPLLQVSPARCIQISLIYLSGAWPFSGPS